MTRTIRFFDGNYICCSTYGKPRSKDFHWKYFKQLLQENDLPDIRWHDLRATYCTILLKNDFNPKAVSKMMGHAKEIITIDVYGDKGVRKHEDYMSKYFISQYGAIKDIDFTPIFEEILCDEKEG